jgi:hypothetical protein
MKEISARIVNISMREINRREFDMRKVNARRVNVRVINKCERIVFRFYFSFIRFRSAQSNRIKSSVDI